MTSLSPDRIQEDLKPSEKKALIDLRILLEEVISTNSLLSPHHSQKKNTRVASSNPDLDQDLADIFLWGIPLLPSKRHEGTNVILLKFLRANDAKPLEALEMIRRTLKWRREFGVSSMTDNEESVGPSLFKGTAYLSGFDREGRPVNYNMYGVLKEQVLCKKALGSEEMREKFLRSSVHFMEKGIKRLSLKPGGTGSMVQVIDLKDSSIASTKELRQTVKRLFSIFEDHYPEFVEQHIFINVSFRFFAYHALVSRNVSQRTRNKFIFARPSKVTETLLKFISPENIPIQYGGLHRENDDEFSDKDGGAEMSLKGGTVATIEIPIAKPGVTVVWDIAVAGWEVHYKEEFIPDDECSYRVLIRKEKKLEETARNSFYINEPGKIVLTVTNRTFKKKKIIYRSITKLTVPLYNLLSQPNA